MATQTMAITRIFPEVTIVSIILGVLIFLILLPFFVLIWTNFTAFGQILTFILGVWIASKFLERR